jgi:hypothetical protein
MKPVYTRREFIKCSAMSLAALWVTACAPGLPRARPDDAPVHYYLNHQDTILEGVDPFLKAIRNRLKRTKNENSAQKIIEQTHQNFIALLPDLPYIGGDNNTLTPTFYQSALALAFYQVMKQQGETLEESGKTLYQAMRALILTPEVLGGADIKMANSQAARDYFKNTAAYSQKRQYPEDWLYYFVQGDGVSFDYGVDYQECAICKYFKSQNAFELARYLCLGDYPISQQYETGLVRSTTLANGGTVCDFRYQSGRQPNIEWMPEFLIKGS